MSYPPAMNEKPNWHARAFRAVKLARGWGVEISDPGAIPWTISGFEAEADALEWITKERRKLTSE
jgi:hypothetical protein